jgi:hypothetical protein
MWLRQFFAYRLRLHRQPHDGGAVRMAGLYGRPPRHDGVR